jgi:hypothetical protein
MLDRLRESKLSPDDMADILTVIAYEPSVLITWLRGIDNIKNYGASGLLRDYPQDAKAIGITDDTADQLDEFNDFEPWYIPSVKEAYKGVVRTQFCLKMNGLDDLSQVGAIAFTNDTETADDFALYEKSRLWTAWADRKGANAILKGGVKKGKTNFALWLSERFIEEGRTVLANVHVLNTPKGFSFTSSLSAQLKAICHAKLEKKRVLLVMDEGALFWHKIDTIMKQNKALASMVLTWGKCDANLLFVSHYQSSIPSVIMQGTVAEFEKMSQKNAFVIMREGLNMTGRLITSVPPTTLKYDPDEVQYMRIDVQPSAIFDFLSSLPDNSNQWEALLGYLDQHEGELSDSGPITDEEIAKTLRTKYKASFGDIANAMKKSKSVVHSWASGNEPDNKPRQNERSHSET